MDSRCILMAAALLFHQQFHMGTSRGINDTFLGINLGTTYSRVGLVLSGQVEIITDDRVTFTGTDPLVGEAANNQAASNLHRTIFDVNRIIGHKFKEEEVQEEMKRLWYKVVYKDEIWPFNIEVEVIDGEVKSWMPKEISTMVLTKMKQMAESYLGHHVKSAIITIPDGMRVVPYFNEAQAEATKEAGKTAGLQFVRLIREPVMAAMAYLGLEKVDESDEKNILVYDLGGGTLQVSVVRLEMTIYEVLSNNGITNFGGDDFTHRLIDYFTTIIKNKHGKDIANGNYTTASLSKLQTECERAKRELSSHHQVTLEIESLFDGIDFSEPLTRATFEDLNNDLFNKTTGPIELAMDDAGLNKSDIDEIMLVGGSTRIPKIQAMVKEFFDGKEPNKGMINPDEAMAYGAAVLGEFIRTYPIDDIEMNQTRVGELSVGIETVGGVMTPLVKNTDMFPVNKSRVFTTYKDQQTSVDIKVFVGGRSWTRFCCELAKFTLSGIAPAPRGVPQIEVTIEAGNEWRVIAEDKATKNKQSITINVSKGNHCLGVAFRKEMEDGCRQEGEGSENKLELYF